MITEQIHANNLAQLKGSSISLTAHHLLTRDMLSMSGSFFYAVYIHYRWELKLLPTHCPCGKILKDDDTVLRLKWKRVGVIHRRHDEVGDLLAATIHEVAYDVSTEPALAQLSGELLPSSTNSADDRRVDITATRFWQEK